MNNWFYITIIFIIGLILLFIYYRSIIVVGLLNRHKNDFLHNFISQFVWFFYQILMPKNADNTKISNRLIWYWPLTVLFTIAFWYGVVILAFSLIFWATGASKTFVDSLLASGSSLSTLGFLTPSDLLGRVLGIIEGGIGLFAVFYLFTFVPDYIATVRIREIQVENIYARAGDPPLGVKLVEWYYKTKESNELGSLFEQWEGWFRELGETHDTAPTLSLIPSSSPEKKWVKAVLCMLDTVNFISCFAEDPLQSQASLCLQAGTKAVDDIATNLRIGGHNKDIGKLPSISKDEIESLSLGQKDFKVLITKLNEDLWATYSTNREKYSRAILILAERTFAKL